MNKFLKPETGRLILDVPNADSLWTYFFKEFGIAFDVPRHLYMYTPSTLEALLKKAGFHILSLRYRSSSLQVAQCLELLGKSMPGKWKEFDLPEGLYDSSLLGSFEPLSQLANNLKLGGAIRVVASR